MVSPAVLPYIFFAIGIVIGSFLCLCAYRIPRGESILYPPSRCSHCGRRIKAIDLVPLLNYVWLRGRCRFCGCGISVFHPLSELSTGLLFMAACLCYGLSVPLIKALFFISLFILISVIDMEHYIIPDKVIVFALCVGIIFMIFTGDPAFTSALAGFGAALLFLLVLAVASRGGMGGGDIKLAAVMGLCLGWPNGAVAVLLGCLLAGLAGLTLILLKVKCRKDVIPFGPFLSAGTLIALHSGSEIISWYFNSVLIVN
ncbi:prepilin peptidase [Pelotomaculum propionicicum]|uniref:prepilin peptidase n=1 Tax=Pelotomaculum propionicicum TaxID=258475 RepID=UPI003B7AB849